VPEVVADANRATDLASSIGKASRGIAGLENLLLTSPGRYVSLRYIDISCYHSYDLEGAVKDVRWKQRFNNFQKAFLFLERVVHQGSYDELQRAGVIQSFEFTFELARKTLKDYQELLGISLNYPRAIIKEAYKGKIIQDGELWIAMLDHRNELTHTYNEDQAERAVQIIRCRYFPALQQVYQHLERLA
jgi:nucleotidyltransferase substrate binding protein (TIGR01987 family)